MRRCSTFFKEAAPENANVHGKLKWVIEEDVLGHYRLKFWLGRVQTPKLYRFGTKAEAQRWIETLCVKVDQDEADEIVRREQKKARSQEMAQRFQVGTLLYNSWGYDQTNVDFYQIVEVRGKKVKMRPIAGNCTSGEGRGSQKTSALPNQFIGDEVLTKMIGPYGISMDHGSCSITSPDRQHYYSSDY